MNNLNYFRTIPIGILIFLFLQCDPGYEYNFYIQNNSSKHISGHFLNRGENSTDPRFYKHDSFDIITKAIKLIFHEAGLGTVSNLTQTPDTLKQYYCIDSLYIYVDTNLKYQQTPIDFTKWQHSGVLDGEGTSNYTFVVTDSLLN